MKQNAIKLHHQSTKLSTCIHGIPQYRVPGFDTGWEVRDSRIPVYISQIILARIMWTLDQNLKFEFHVESKLNSREFLMRNSSGIQSVCLSESTLQKDAAALLHDAAEQRIVIQRWASRASCDFKNNAG